MLNNLLANAGDIRDASLIPGSGRSPGEGHGNPLQYSCLEIPMDTGDWRLQSIASHGVGHDWRNEAPTHARTQQWECRCPFKTQISCPLGIYSEELQKSDSIPRIDLYGQAMPLISDSILFLNSLCFHKRLLVGGLAVRRSVYIPGSVEFLKKHGWGNLEVSHCRELHGVE